jgi:hypothetical protein
VEYKKILFLREASGQRKVSEEDFHKFERAKKNFFVQLVTFVLVKMYHSENLRDIVGGDVVQNSNFLFFFLRTNDPSSKPTVLRFQF